MSKTNYEVRELKKLIVNDRPIGLYLVVHNNQYIATVEFDYFAGFCSAIDNSTPCGELEPEACKAVASYVVTHIKQTMLHHCKQMKSWQKALESIED